MKAEVVLHHLGSLLGLLGVALASGIGVAWAYAESDGIVWMGLSAAATVLVGVGLAAGYRKARGLPVTRRDAFLIVSLAWAAIGAFGALPYLLSGVLSNPADALFESISGFTTTGSSVIAHPSDLPRYIQYWRSLTQWLGGMGIIVLFVAVFSELGVGGRFLFSSEVPGPISETVKPRIRDTSAALWKIYLLFTLAQVLALIATGIGPFDALCHAFTTMSTGGFSTRDDSLAAFPAAAQWVVVAFMVLAGANFSLYHVAFLGRATTLARDRELRAYLGLLAVATMLIALNTAGRFHGVEESLRHSAFQVVSLATTTGFVTDNYDEYPSFARLLLVMLMFVGGCAGSTAGGIKVVRLAILMKVLYRGLVRQVRPSIVMPIRLGRTVIPEQSIEETSGFFFIYLLTFALASLFVAAHGLDLATSLSATAATLGNIGPGLERVGAISHYGDMPAAVKVVLSLCMILGRLEMYTVLGLLIPSFWRR